MYYELYIDVLFLENLLLDYLLLCLLRRLLKCSCTRLRLLLGAGLGSAGLCVIWLFSLNGTFVGSLLLYVIFSTAMVKIGLHIRGWRSLAKAVVLLYITSFLLGGIFGWLKQNLRLPVYPFLGFSLISYRVLSAAMGWLMRVRDREALLLTVVIGFHGREMEVRALLDTGNHLYDPIFRKPVSIVTEKLKCRLCQEDEVLFCQVPFHSIGKKDGLMPAFFADYVRLETQGGVEKRVDRPLLGITKEPLSSKNEYDMILHPDLLE